jgi:isopenicillin N synthase-like dioxygenase
MAAVLSYFLNDRGSSIRDAASELLDRGSVIVKADEGLVKNLDEVFSSAGNFFALSPREKMRYERPDILEGYRRYGAEYSGLRNRPDLNETYAMVLGNTAHKDIAVWPTTNPLHRALRAAAPRYVALVGGLLDEIRREINPRGDRVSTAALSYFQLNHYLPRFETRTFLQDTHEDGHLLTVVTSRQPGLEAEIDGCFQQINFRDDELMVMPGSILTLMTGGRIKPLPHRVRNVRSVPVRSSLMFFANAPVAGAPRAWAAAADGSMPDIGRATAERSTMFGLPSISTLAR